MSEMAECDRWHVMPVCDLREHQSSIECWCNPIIDGDVVVHNSMDRREEYENGRKKH